MRKRHGGHAQPLVEIRRLLCQGNLDEFDRGRMIANEFMEERFGRLARFAPGSVESYHDEAVFFVDDVVFVGGEGVDGLDGESSLRRLFGGRGGPSEEFG